MKFYKILFVASLLFLGSCDKNNTNEEAMEALAGHWHVWTFEPNADSPVDASLLAKESIVKLVKESCDPLEYTFYKAGDVLYIDGMKYLNASMVDGEVEVDCESKYDEKIGTFDFNFSKLTIKFDSETVKLDAVLEDEFFITQVDNMLINGVEVSGKLYYIRETGN